MQGRALAGGSSPWSSSQAGVLSDQQRSAASTPGIPSYHPSAFPTKTTGPIASLRARQIQADEGILSSPYRSPMRQTSGSDDPVIPSGGFANGASREGLDGLTPGESRLFGRRARAGTLPSSWENNNVKNDSSFRTDTGQKMYGNANGSRNAFDVASDHFWSHSSSHTGARTPSIRLSDAQVEAFAGSIPSASSSPLHNGSSSQQGLSPNVTYPSSRLVQTRGQRSNSALEFDRTSNILPDLISQSPTLITNSPSGPLDNIQDANRKRSGSTASVKSGLGNSAFGPSLFSNTWTDPRLPVSIASPSSGLGTNLASSTASTVDDYRGSRDAYEARRESQSLFDLAGRQTLDYLGLDNNDETASNRVTSAHAISQRNRASTLASVPRENQTSSLQSGNYYGARELYSNDRSERYEGISDAQILTNYALDHGMDMSQLTAMATAMGIHISDSTTSVQSRNRAGTIHALGGQGGRQHIIEELLKRVAASGQGVNLNGLGIGSLMDVQAASLASDRTHSKAPLENFPHLQISTPPLVTPIRSSPSTPATALSGTNKSSSHDGQSYAPWGREAGMVGSQIADASASGSSNAAARSSHQVPTRSLWIGNLDGKTTGQELMRVFATYGAIESLRLLPEKECGFVNFVELNDAVKAREDVLGRLGGRLENLGTGSNGTVRIGYGKIDSTPNGSSFKITPSTQNSVGNNLDATNSVNDNGLDSAPMSSTGSEGGVVTRALWVGGIPASITSATLLNIFQPFGPVESARILTHKNCAFINYERVEDAIRARKMLHGRDVLGNDVGMMKIGFAKVPIRNNDAAPNSTGVLDQSRHDWALDSNSGQKGIRASSSISAEVSSIAGMGMDNHRSNLMAKLYKQGPKEKEEGVNATLNSAISQLLINKQATTSSSSSIVPASDKGGVPLPAYMMPRPTMNDLQILMSHLSAGQVNQEVDVASVAEYRPSATYYMTIPLVTEVSSGRRFETSRLREARRSIESGQLDMHQCDQLAREYLDSIVDLASDYIGNTLVQKFFEYGSEDIKMEMLHHLAPHLAMTGCHKNGTWAAQKIIDCCRSADQITLIAQHLRPYIPGLLLDQFGNYVVQCCLPWKQPTNDFVFDAMVDRCWEVAQGRFGARSMRACLEKDSVTDQQRKRVAMSVILNSVPLATSPNGSLLLTWLMETPALSKSYKLLAPRFSPHLTHLCTHKLASTPVLRIVGQTFEPEASQLILDALFEGAKDEVLEEIVIDQVHGSQFITKVLACGNLSTEQRDKYATQVRALVEKHQLIGVPAYRRLCEDLGLLSPSLTVATSINERRSYPTSMNDHAAAAPFVSTLASSGQTSMQNPSMTIRPHSNMPTFSPPDAFNPYWELSSPAYKYQSPPGRPYGTQ